MKIPLKAEVAIRTPGGAVGLGLADWADETRIQIRSELVIEEDDELALQLGVEGLPGKLSMTAVVQQKRMAGETPVLVCLRKEMDLQALERFQAWMETVSDGGHTVDPASWMGREGTSASSDVDTYIEARKTAGRDSLQRALQDSLTVRAELGEDDEDPVTDLPSTPSVGPSSDRTGLEVIGPDNGTLTVIFHDGGTLQRHLEHLLGGEMRLPHAIAGARLEMRMILPDGQKLLLPVETRPGQGRTWLVFRMKRALKTKLKRAARA